MYEKRYNLGILKKKKKFVTIFEKCENVHLIKDVGQIPYMFYKYFNCDSTIVTVKNSKRYTYLDTDVKGLEIKFIPKIKLSRYNLSTIFYIILNAKKIDILHLMHNKEHNFLYSILYKLFNSNGHVFIKSDISYNGLISYNGIVPEKKRKYFFRRFLFNKAIKKIDTISIESKDGYEFLQHRYPKYMSKFFYLSNSVDLEAFYEKQSKLEYTKKENIILTVGRIGAVEKRNELLLNAIKSLDLESWKVIFIGPIKEDFKRTIEKFFLKNPHLSDSVIFKGEVIDRKQLLEYYAKSKVFCLTSKAESFGLVFLEAMAYGNYILTTKVSSANLVTNNEEYGKIIKDSRELSNEIKLIIENKNDISELNSKIINYTVDKFDWRTNLANLNKRFNQEL